MSEKLIKTEGNLIKGASKNKIDLSNFNSKSYSEALSKFEIPRLYYQLIIFVLDASDSMTWQGITGKSKGEEIHEQIIPIIARLQSSKNKNCFDVNMHAFSMSSKEFLKETNVVKIDLNQADFNPCNHLGNYKTYLAKTLEMVEKNVNKYYKNHEHNSQALIILLSDGALDDYEESNEICSRIKSNKKTTIASYLFEDKNWSASLSHERLKEFQDNIRNLSSIDSNGINFFHSKINPEEIRNHMIKSISTISKID
jgi:uncharacterized protein YegL